MQPHPYPPLLDACSIDRCSHIPGHPSLMLAQSIDAAASLVTPPSTYASFMCAGDESIWLLSDSVRLAAVHTDVSGLVANGCTSPHPPPAHHYCTSLIARHRSPPPTHHYCTSLIALYRSPPPAHHYRTSLTAHLQPRLTWCSTPRAAPHSMLHCRCRAASLSPLRSHRFALTVLRSHRFALTASLSPLRSRRFALTASLSPFFALTASLSPFFALTASLSPFFALTVLRSHRFAITALCSHCCLLFWLSPLCSHRFALTAVLLLLFAVTAVCSYCCLLFWLSQVTLAPTCSVCSPATLTSI